jgi:hypothetical protein
LAGSSVSLALQIPGLVCGKMRIIEFVPGVTSAMSCEFVNGGGQAWALRQSGCRFRKQFGNVNLPNGAALCGLPYASGLQLEPQL